MAAPFDTEPHCPHPSPTLQTENRAATALFSAPPCSPSCKECLGHQHPVMGNPLARTPFSEMWGSSAICFIFLSVIHPYLVWICSDVPLPVALVFFAMFSFPLVAVVPSHTQGRLRQPHTTPKLLWIRTDHPHFSEELMRSSAHGYNSTQLPSSDFPGH